MNASKTFESWKRCEAAHYFVRGERLDYLQSIIPTHGIGMFNRNDHSKSFYVPKCRTTKLEHSIIVIEACEVAREQVGSSPLEYKVTLVLNMRRCKYGIVFPKYYPFMHSMVQDPSMVFIYSMPKTKDGMQDLEKAAAQIVAQLKMAENVCMPYIPAAGSDRGLLKETGD